MADRGDSMELQAERISSDGSSVGRLSDGMTVFIAGALPGERVRGRITARKKSYAVAVAEEILEAHPSRSTPPCPVYHRCGACQLQHASYPLQLELKRAILEDAFRRICKRPFPEIPPCIPSPDQTGYRNKVSLPVREAGGLPAMGYYARGSHDIVPMKSCLVAAKLIDRAFATVSAALPALGIPAYDERSGKGVLRHAIFRHGIKTGELLVSLVIASPLKARQRNRLEEQLVARLKSEFPGLRSFTLNLNRSPGNVITGLETEAILGDGLVEEELSPFRFECDTTSFFQVNTCQARAMYEYAARAGGVAQAANVLELYAGSGGLTAFLAGAAGRITAVEEWPPAVSLMESNMERNGMKERVTIAPGAVEKVIPDLKESFDLVVLDPPRTGCTPDVLRGVLSLKPSTIVYVSCNPATLARDAATLVDGGYSIESLTCFDMFPQTVHVETVAVLSIGHCRF